MNGLCVIGMSLFFAMGMALWRQHAGVLRYVDFMTLLFAIFAYRYSLRRKDPWFPTLFVALVIGTAGASLSLAHMGVMVVAYSMTACLFVPVIQRLGRQHPMIDAFIFGCVAVSVHAIYLVYTAIYYGVSLGSQLPSLLMVGGSHALSFFVLLGIGRWLWD